MKIQKSFLLFYGILLTVLSVCGAEVADKKMVWAHNTPWFRPEDYSLFTTWYYNYPLQESVNDANIRQNTLKEEFKIAKGAGIDGFFLDVGTDPKRGPFHWSMIIKDYLKAAEGTDFQIGICVDGYPRRTAEDPRGVDYEVKEIVRMLKENSNHPNYPKYEGRPIVFTYVYNQPDSWSSEDWQKVREGVKKGGFDIYLVANLSPWPNRSINLEKEEMYKDTFDAVYLFDSPAHANEPLGINNKIFKKFCDDNGKMFIPTLHPGYNTEGMIGNPFYNAFRGADFLLMTYNEAKKIPANWFHLTTWNDMMETGATERAYTFGLIDSIRYYCFNLKGIPFKFKDPKILLAYHREELTGTLLRIEAVNYPSENQNPVTISGYLLDLEGKRVAKLPQKTFAPGKITCAEWLIPTAKLANTPVLVPELTAAAGNWKKTVKAPAVLLVSGWIHNTNTINVPLDRMITFPNTLKVARSSSKVISADITFDAPSKIRRITLFKNDRPVGVFEKDLKKDEVVFNIRLSGDMNLGVLNGRILRGLKKGAQYNGCNNFKYTEKGLFNVANSGGIAMTFAGTPELALKINQYRQKKDIIVTADEIVDKRIIRGKDLMLCTAPDGTLLLSKPLEIAKGKMTLNFFDIKPNAHDSYYVRYDMMDGNVQFTSPIFPFGKNESVSIPILETKTTMETRVWCMRNTLEYLTPLKKLPVQKDRVVRAAVSKLSNRTAYWPFDGNGTDFASDHYAGQLYIADEHFADGGFNGKGKALKFTGKGNIKLRHLAWPYAGAGVTSFYIKPDACKGKKQSVIYKDFWQDGLCINLLENGCVEVVRVYADGMTEKLLFERFSGKTPLTPGKWHKIEIKGDAASIRLFVNGKEDGSLSPKALRTYGPARIYLGGGMPGYENFSGELDELFLSGL